MCEGGGGELQFNNCFFSFCRNLAFNHVNFHFPAIFFSPALLNFEHCFL